MEAFACEKDYLSILCVEDDPDVRNFLKETIKRRFPFATIHMAENGIMGLEMFKKHAPHLTITDVCMPLMDGILMAKEIRLIEPAAMILVLTAYSDTSYLLDAIRTGISDYLVKPVNPELLCKAINNIAGKLIIDSKANEECALIGDLPVISEKGLGTMRLGEESVSTDHIKTVFNPLAGYNPEEAADPSQQVVNALISGNREIAAYCYRLAHDLRSPLNGINITSEALIMLFGDQLNDECKTFIEYIKEEVLRMNKMIDGILLMSKDSS